MANKTKSHVRYKLQCGTLVPGVTTVLSLLNKPSLLAWAYNCGVNGIDYRKVRDQAADIGTIAHYLILCELKHEKPNLSEYAPADIEKAQNCLTSYHAWVQQNPIVPILTEEPLVSERFGYGGTPDCYGTTTQGTVLLDFKTGKGLYPEYSYQCAAYRQLLLEHNGKYPDKVIILRINKERNDDFEVRTVGQLDKHFDVFRHLLQVYHLQKELE